MTFKKYLQIFEKRAVKIEKRLRLVISVFISTGLVVFSTFFYFDKAPMFIPLLFVASFLLTYFALLEEIEETDWFFFISCFREGG